VHEERGFLGSAARGFSSICNLETFVEIGIVKIGIPWFNGSCRWSVVGWQWSEHEAFSQ
jgi:hypothetical protein